MTSDLKAIVSVNDLLLHLFYYENKKRWHIRFCFIVIYDLQLCGFRVFEVDILVRLLD